MHPNTYKGRDRNDRITTRLAFACMYGSFSTCLSIPLHGHHLTEADGRSSKKEEAVPRESFLHFVAVSQKQAALNYIPKKVDRSPGKGREEERGRGRAESRDKMEKAKAREERQKKRERCSNRSSSSFLLVCLLITNILAGLLFYYSIREVNCFWQLIFYLGTWYNFRTSV